MLLLILITLILLLCSFAASSMEASLFSVTMVQVEQMVEQKLHGAALLKKNKDGIQDSIIALVILNNVANIAGSILVGSIAAEVFDNLWLGIYSASLTFVIIIVGEVIPKTIGELYAPAYARNTAFFIYVLRKIFRPFTLIIGFVLKPFSSSSSAVSRFHEEHITVLANIGHKAGTIQETEKLLIRQVFKLNDIMAESIMTPRTVVFAFHADATVAEVAPQLYKATVSRIPIYEDDLDSIVGIVHIRDLLSALARGNAAKPLRDFADEPLFVPETARADMLLKTFQRERQHLAVVVDEYGGTAGVVTLEDILEQLVGEIVDEYDKDVDLRVKARLLREQRNRGYNTDWGSSRK